MAVVYLLVRQPIGKTCTAVRDSFDCTYKTIFHDFESAFVREGICLAYCIGTVVVFRSERLRVLLENQEGLDNLQSNDLDPHNGSIPHRLRVALCCSSVVQAIASENSHLWRHYSFSITRLWFEHTHAKY